MCDDHGMPVQTRGVVEGYPGLYFVGQNYQYAKASETVLGVSRDARYVAHHIARLVLQRDDEVAVSAKGWGRS